ncbi:MAG: hypothetical protein PSV13_00065 [Lacunisphaera sp.]|nr:hypothetical protein [Lacunisphaera sp.]
MKDLYINLDGRRIELRKADFGVSTEIYKGMTGGQSVFEVKDEVWRAANFSLPKGIDGVYVSGYRDGVALTPAGTIKIVGELAAFRTDLAGQQKSYRTLLVSTGDSALFYGEEYKDYPQHYYAGAHPTGEIWGKVHPVTRLAVKTIVGISGYLGLM